MRKCNVEEISHERACQVPVLHNTKTERNGALLTCWCFDRAKGSPPPLLRSHVGQRMTIRQQFVPLRRRKIAEASTALNCSRPPGWACFAQAMALADCILCPFRIPPVHGQGRLWDQGTLLSRVRMPSDRSGKDHVFIERSWRCFTLWVLSPNVIPFCAPGCRFLDP